MTHDPSRGGQLRRIALLVFLFALLAVFAGVRVSASNGEGGAAGEGGGHEAKLYPLVPEIGSASFHLGPTVWTWITFAVVLAVLWKFAWNPLLSSLDARSARIKADLDAAEKERSDAEGLRRQYEERIAQADRDAAAIVADGKADAEVTAKEILEGARKEAEAIKARANREIDQAKMRALVEVWTQGADLSCRIASRVLERAVAPDDHRRLIDDTIEEYRRQVGPA
ncbi:MAG: F0F1 ATP synthase subunit B [Planctomycetes bacterium]|nr:F0F1 ATP synthase subunit B [Planctomycetota bacterium]